MLGPSYVSDRPEKFLSIPVESRVYIEVESLSCNSKLEITRNDKKDMKT